jgi:hypothetical protein
VTAHLRIAQLDLDLPGGSGRVITAEATGDENVRTALRMVGSAIAGQPLARRRDVETSPAAAARAKAILPDHEMRILEAIAKAGERGACSKEIARATGRLTHIQVDRRLAGMRERGVILRLYERDADDCRRLVKREGCACWVKA